MTFRMQKCYKDYPNVHWLIAGDTHANCGVGYDFIAYRPIPPGGDDVFAKAEEFLANSGLTTDEMYNAGYETNCGMCLDDSGDYISDLPEPQQTKEWQRLYAKYKINDPSIHELFKLLY